MAPAVELSGIAKLYGRTAALRSLSLRVEPGETLAVLGPNGSGKTTLLKILAGAITPTLGSGSILGRDILIDRRTLRNEVGLMAAESYLYDDLSARENLCFMLTMAGRRPDKAEIENTLDGVGLLRQTDERVRNFSSGMKRRLSLGRLVALRPRLVLLDEPYNSLDSSAADLVDEMVRRAAVEGRSTILATHDTERALALADRVACLDRGALTYLGPTRGYRQSHAQYVG